MSQRSKKRKRGDAADSTGRGKSAAASIEVPGVAIERDQPGATASTAQGGAVRSLKWETAGICALLVILVFGVFGQTLHFDFVNYDDNLYVNKNPMVSKGLSPGGIGWAFTHIVAGHWHPLTVIVLMIESQIFGLSPGGFHFGNVLLHAAGAVFLFLLLRELTGYIWRSGFVAATFAIHPLRAQSVAWISECKDVLSGMFFMLTLMAYVRYARRPGLHARYAVVMVMFGLGLMSKPMLVTVPCVLLLLDWWPLGRLRAMSQLPGLLWEKFPLFALSALSSMAAVLALKSGTAPIYTHPGNALISYAAYLGKLIYPVDLVAVVPIPDAGYPGWEEFGAILLLAALTAGAYFYRREKPFLLVGWLWYLGMLVPVIGLMQTQDQAYADRYTYLPTIGLWIGGTWAAADWAGRMRGRRLALKIAGLAILGALAITCWRQTRYWRDSMTLWTHTLDCTQDNAQAHENLGLALMDAGRIDEAIAEMRTAIGINPRDPLTLNLLGETLMRGHHVEEALEQYQAALQILPTYEDTHFNIGNALKAEGRMESAIAEYQAALRLDPADGEAHTNLGSAYLAEGRPKEALAEAREGARLEPGLGAAHNILGSALLAAGQTQEAIAQYRQALQIDPKDVDFHGNLGEALLRAGEANPAIAEFNEALRINPANADVHYNLGNALLQMGQFDQAIAQYRAALQIDPRYATAHGNLGLAFFQQGQIEKATAEFREAVRIDPQYGNAHANLGLALYRQGRLPEAIAEYREALRIQPGGVEAHYNLANALIAGGHTGEAIAEFQKAIDLQPANPMYKNALAWTLATTAQTSLRDGARAVELAANAGQATGGNDPAILRTLAAAYAQAGQYPNAVQTAQRALELAKAQSNAVLVGALMREISLYEAHRPFEAAH